MNDYEFIAKRRLTGRLIDMTAGRFTNKQRIKLRLAGLAFCPRCEKAVELLTFDEAARSFNTDLQDILLLAENGDLHRLYNRRAKVMICGKSLVDFFESRRTRLLDSHFVNSMSA